MSIAKETDMHRPDLKDVMLKKICEMIFEVESLG